MAAPAEHDSPNRRLLREDIERLRRHPRLRALALEYCVRIAPEPMRWPWRKLLTQEFRYEICFRLISNMRAGIVPAASHRRLLQ
jgi:hypothetical protein